MRVVCVWWGGGGGGGGGDSIGTLQVPHPLGTIFPHTNQPCWILLVSPSVNRADLGGHNGPLVAEVC